MSIDIDYLNRRYKISRRGNSWYVLVPSDIAKYLGIDRNTHEVGMLIHELIKDHKVIDLVTIKKQKDCFVSPSNKRIVYVNISFGQENNFSAKTKFKKIRLFPDFLWTRLPFLN